MAATPAGAAPELNAVALTEPQPGFAERDRTIGRPSSPRWRSR
ncbi:hypothetical protein ACFQZ4_06810 [Catellatospora coxensis]